MRLIITPRSQPSTTCSLRRHPPSQIITRLRVQMQSRIKILKCYITSAQRKALDNTVIKTWVKRRKCAPPDSFASTSWKCLGNYTIWIKASTLNLNFHRASVNLQCLWLSTKMNSSMATTNPEDLPAYSETTRVPWWVAWISATISVNTTVRWTWARDQNSNFRTIIASRSRGI